MLKNGFNWAVHQNAEGKKKTTYSDIIFFNQELDVEGACDLKLWGNLVSCFLDL